MGRKVATPWVAPLFFFVWLNHLLLPVQAQSVSNATVAANNPTVPTYQVSVTRSSAVQFSIQRKLTASPAARPRCREHRAISGAACPKSSRRIGIAVHQSRRHAPPQPLTNGIVKVRVVEGVPNYALRRKSVPPLPHGRFQHLTSSILKCAAIRRWPRRILIKF